MRRVIVRGRAMIAASALLAALHCGTAAYASQGSFPTEGDSFEPTLGLPETAAFGEGSVVVIGSSPAEAKGEAWAFGAIGDVPAVVNGKSYARQYTLLEHRANEGWQVVPLPSRPNGEPLSSPNSAQGSLPENLGPFGGRTTAAGGVVLLTDGGIVARDPEGEPKLVPKVPEGLLHGHETIPPEPTPSGANTPYAAVEEAGGETRHTGILMAPYHDGESGAPTVLHLDGPEGKWTSEELSGAVISEHDPGFTADALVCGGASGTSPDESSPTNCWLLAAYDSEGSGAPNRLALFRRTLVSQQTEPARYVWRQQDVAGGLLGEESSATATTALPLGAQMLTATPQGVWVDLRAKVAGATQPTTATELVSASGAPTKKWCYPAIPAICPQSLGASLPTPYQSFAWPGSGEDPGSRIITNLPHGAMLELSNEQFSYETGAGGQLGVTGPRLGSFGGAAFSTPTEGWIGNGTGTISPDFQGQAQMIEVTSSSLGDQLQSEPLPFRYPLLALAQAPGTEAGSAGAPAVAVGINGEIGRYLPGQGWQPESLLNSAGKTQTPTLRGVAWPEQGRAYAVGDSGAMWLWQADTGLWEPDPAKPLNFLGNLTAIAFSQSSPGIGYAVGKNGVLLAFGKSWIQEQLPAELAHVNFTSVSFAGNQALATYREVVEEPGTGNGPVEAGGVAVKEGGEPWHVDPGAAALLSQLPHPKDTILSKVAGLADGGVVAAGPGLVIERDSPTAQWRFSTQPLPEARNISALGAYRESSGAVRAVLAADLDPFLAPNGRGGALQTGPWKGDLPPPVGPEQPPFFSPPDPLPDGGYLLKETATGWNDMEHTALQVAGMGNLPVRSDPVLALIVDPSGDAGLAVGGQTQDAKGSNQGGITGVEALLETASAMRFGATAASSGDVSAQVVTPVGDANFAVGGNAACVTECAALSGQGLGPDVWLSHALQRAGQIASGSPGGLREFLYTGGRLQEAPKAGAEPETMENFEREMARYGSLLAGAPVPVRTTASPTDRTPGIGGTSIFTSQLGSFLPNAQAGNAYYSYLSTGPGGGPAVEVIVLDFSTGTIEGAQQAWLESELKLAREHRNAQGEREPEPAIVMGNESLGFTLPVEETAPVLAKDATAVSAILVEDGASAYVFDYPGANVQTQIAFGSGRIPAFGTGTLGDTPALGGTLTDFLGSSGFLILSVSPLAPCAPSAAQCSNVANVTAHIEPNISQLAIQASDGVLLRRSQVALFEALARRPAGGSATDVSQRVIGPDPYDPIPFNCLGPNCANAVPAEYTFSSSDPEVGNFVAHDPTSADPRQVLLGSNKLPVADSHSGLFCAFNAGTTTVSITTGGLTYSEPVTVQAGSVEYPCGTVPLKALPPQEAPASANFKVPAITPAAAPPPVSPQLPVIAVPPAPVIPPLAPPVIVHPPAPPLANVFSPLPGAIAVPVIVPPATLPVEPTPPSGAAQVFEPAPATKEEKEEEEAIETENSAMAYDANANHNSGPGPWAIVLLAVVAAGAGVGMRPRRRSRREQPALAISSSRRQSSPRGHDRRRRP